MFKGMFQVIKAVDKAFEAALGFNINMSILNSMLKRCKESGYGWMDRWIDGLPRLDCNSKYEVKYDTYTKRFY